MVRESAQRKGDEVAIVDERGTLSWSGLDARANQVIHLLRDAGLEPGDTIAIMSGNRRELFEVEIAATHTSLVYVPVNWHWVSDELAYVLADSDARALFVEDQYAEVARAALADPRTAACSLRVTFADRAIDGFATYEDLVGASSAAEPDGQANGGPMFYTSGTTGFPKGVRTALNTTGLDLGLVTLVGAAMCESLGIPRDGVTLLDGPAYHSAQLALSLFPLLAQGNTCVMRQHFDAASHLELIERHGVTNIHLVPTQFGRLLKLPDVVRAGFDGSSLVSVIHGAAPCPTAVKRAMIEWWGPVITEYYGGTESGFLTIITSDEWLAHPGSVGRAQPWCELMVLGEDHEPRGPGEVGQIFWRSLGGGDFSYHKAEDKTAAAHLAPGVGTIGDVGYLDGDGYLHLSDRRIDMIVSGGVNIYPAEIEGVLVTHPAVADAAVFGIPDEDMGEQVKAAVELVDGLAGSHELAAELIAFVRQHLAGYKAPRTLDFEARLPRSATGKLYKRLLRDPYWEGTGRAI
ncbi:MAG: AMP-binding protein [Acidobacteriota bacterium]|nr:AMP-binding protein [Acidobacteriota bacterium]